MSAFEHASIPANERQPKESRVTVSSAQRGGDGTSFPSDFSAAASVCIVVLKGEIIRLSDNKETRLKRWIDLKVSDSSPRNTTPIKVYSCVVALFES